MTSNKKKKKKKRRRNKRRRRKKKKKRRRRRKKKKKKTKKKKTRQVRAVLRNRVRSHPQIRVSLQMTFIKKQEQPCWDTTGGKGKGKAIPVQARTDPESSRRLRLPDFMTICT